MKLRSALLLVVAGTVCALSSLLSPQLASASVDAATQWPSMPPIVSNAAAVGNVSGKFTAGAGNNRLLLVAVATEYTSGNPVIAVGGVTYGGTALTNIAAATNTTGLNKIWVGYLVLGTATASSTATIAVTNTGTAGLVATYVTAAVYNGVDQTTPISGSGSASGTTAALTTTNFAVNGINGNNGLGVFISNRTSSTLSTTGTATKVREYVGLNMTLSAGAESVVTNAADNETVTAAAAVSGVLAGIGLNPVAKVATLTTCGDCHGYPPNDGSARNVPPGQFLGSHDKHSGANANQYSFLCTQCHYNNTTNKHQQGYKNITGSSVPGNAYSATGGKKVADSNSPVFGYCNNVTCHSNGRTTPRQFATGLNWGTADTCLSCHGGRSNSTNLYAKSTNSFNLSTTHGQHLGKYSYTQINCNMCHGKTASSATATSGHTALKDYSGVGYHANGSKTVLFTNIAYGSYTSYKANKTCVNVACHGGKTRGVWNEQTTVNTDNTCVHCHGAAGTLASVANSGYNRRFFAPGWKKVGTSTDQTASTNDIRVGAHFKHLSSAYMRNIKCNECHLVPQTPFDAGHTDTPRYASQTLSFNQASSATITIGVTSGTAISRLAAFGGYTNGVPGKAVTCSSVYCHGNRLKTGDTSGSYKKPYWNYSAMINYTDPANSCNKCHGLPPSAGTSITTHTGKTLTGVNACANCHGSVVNASGQIINKELHINGQVDVTAGHEYSFGGWRHMPGGIGSIKAASLTDFTACTGCHSGTSGGSYPVASRGQASLLVCTVCHINNPNFYTTGSKGSCGDCHGSNTAGYYSTGQPDGNVFPNNSGSHSAHIAQGYACADCHSGRGTGVKTHGNYSGVKKTTYMNISIAFNTTKTGTAVKYVNGGGTLANTSCNTSWCHGSKSPAWGAPVPAQQCVRCHGSQTLSYANNSSATIAPGGSNIDTNRTAGVTNRGGVHQEHLNATDGISAKIKCGACHAGLSTKAVNHAQLDNRTTATVVFNGLAVANSHGAAGIVRTSGIITCNNTYCHTAKNNSGLNMAPTWNSSTYLPATLTVAACTQCHALPPSSVSSHTGLSVTSFPIGTQCGANCHLNLNTAATTYATIFNDPSQHIDGIIQGGDCISCHSAVQGARAPVVGQFASQSHHIQGGEVLTKASCYKCHWEADINGDEDPAYHSKTSGKGVSLVVWKGSATRPTVASAATLVSYTANGSRRQILKLNDVCLGCHDSTVRATPPFGTFATDQYSPEPRMTPVLSKTSILSRYSSTRTVPWSNYSFTNSSGQVSQYGTNTKKNVTKALSGHGNAIKNQFPSWNSTTGGSGEDEVSGVNVDIAASQTLSKYRNVLCYDCHNSHGSAAVGVTSSYSSATGRYKGGLLKTTTNGQGGYTNTYTPTARTIAYKSYSTLTTHAATFNAGASICNDCHNTDTRKVTYAGGRPWSILTTYSSTKPIVGYWSTPYFDNYTFNSVKRTTYKMGGAPGTIKDQRKPMGGHYGSSANLGNYSGVSHSQNINGLCTPCHDPHGVSSAMSVVNRGKSVPMLKGTWVTSPYREDKATPVVKRGGGSNFTGMPAMGAMPGYNIDQNSLINLAAPTAGGAAQTTTKSNQRKQAFTVFPGAAGNALALHTEKDPDPAVNAAANFAGLCVGCHQKATLTNSTVAPAASNWMSKERVHQSVAGWAATSGVNLNGTVHAYTCSKCHAPHVSRLPRLMITNCLDVRHTKQSVSGGAISATTVGTPGFTYGNNNQSFATSGRGAGRFPSGGSRYSGTPGSAQNNGPWYFQTVQPAGVTYPSNCHNGVNAGGGATTYAPNLQIWNKKTRW